MLGVKRRFLLKRYTVYYTIPAENDVEWRFIQVDAANGMGAERKARRILRRTTALPISIKEWEVRG